MKYLNTHVIWGVGGRGRVSILNEGSEYVFMCVCCRGGVIMANEVSEYTCYVGGG